MQGVSGPVRGQTRERAPAHVGESLPPACEPETGRGSCAEASGMSRARVATRLERHVELDGSNGRRGRPWYRVRSDLARVVWALEYPLHRLAFWVAAEQARPRIPVPGDLKSYDIGEAPGWVEPAAHQYSSVWISDMRLETTDHILVQCIFRDHPTHAENWRDDVVDKTLLREL